MMATTSRLAFLILSIAIVSTRACAIPQDLAEDVFESNETQVDEFYGVLMDAGSSSTKLKIYRWTKPVTTPGVPNITLLELPKKKGKFKPGLADVDGGLEGLKDYLLKILDSAKEYVPVSQYAQTPVFVLATAGFRLLGVAGARQDMECVEDILMNSTFHPFKYTPGGASVLSGEEEAAYSWIAANYLRNFFQDNRCSQGLGPNDNLRAATQRLAGIPWLSLSRSHGTDTDPTSRGPNCARLRLEPATSGPRSEASTN
ncbi:ectonucleoside triphosphate diphosphohydrolase 1 [Elysia marginata]|uniref:Ectonucleoside triphosphate diphosphohydrolase 1 n=1 Tax=Elysia marginata TaxID=1093978 RepID=A0AAV4I097_9GAST|nr:ectonucleoside triphosphate diphosphohydrolase 1 [Elysia marginata]